MTAYEAAAIRRIDFEMSTAWRLIADLEEEMSKQLLPAELRKTAAAAERALSECYSELCGLYPDLYA